MWRSPRGIPLCALCARGDAMAHCLRVSQPATAAGRQRRAWGVAGWDGGGGSGVVAAIEGPP